MYKVCTKNPYKSMMSPLYIPVTPIIWKLCKEIKCNASKNIKVVRGICSSPWVYIGVHPLQGGAGVYKNDLEQKTRSV